MSSFKPGDWVIDANGNVYVRSDHEGWPWDYASDSGARYEYEGQTHTRVPSGAVEETYPQRPLTLIIRDGYPIGGTPVEEKLGSLSEEQQEAPAGRPGLSA